MSPIIEMGFGTIFFLSVTIGGLVFSVSTLTNELDGPAVRLGLGIPSSLLTITAGVLTGACAATLWQLLAM